MDKRLRQYFHFHPVSFQGAVSFEECLRPYFDFELSLRRYLRFYFKNISLWRNVPGNPAESEFGKLMMVMMLLMAMTERVDHGDPHEIDRDADGAGVVALDGDRG